MYVKIYVVCLGISKHRTVKTKNLIIRFTREKTQEIPYYYDLSHVVKDKMKAVQAWPYILDFRSARHFDSVSG